MNKTLTETLPGSDTPATFSDREIFLFRSLRANHCLSSLRFMKAGGQDLDNLSQEVRGPDITGTCESSAQAMPRLCSGYHKLNQLCQELNIQPQSEMVKNLITKANAQIPEITYESKTLTNHDLTEFRVLIMGIIKTYGYSKGLGAERWNGFGQTIENALEMMGTNQEVLEEFIRIYDDLTLRCQSAGVLLPELEAKEKRIFDEIEKVRSGDVLRI